MSQAIRWHVAVGDQRQIIQVGGRRECVGERVIELVSEWVVGARERERESEREWVGS